MSARDDILQRIRTAIGDSHAASADVPRDYNTVGIMKPGDRATLDRFVHRLEDYKAVVHEAAESDIEPTLHRVLDGDRRVVVPAGLPVPWQQAMAPGRVIYPDAVSARPADAAAEMLSADELDDVDGVVTACRVAIAETGTIVLDASSDQGRRAITLVPDHHVVVVFDHQVVASVPEALQRIEPTRPLTFISGPSATSDIEFKRVEGVHGPRRLDVVIVITADEPARS